MMPLSEPTGAQPLLYAVRWVESTLLGSTAIAVATLAVAALGFLMLNGRVPFRRAATVIVGGFILLGSTTLANGIMAITDVNGSGKALTIRAEEDAPAPPSLPPPQSQVYDPYAGAAVPVR